MENPFKFGTVVDGKYFTDRAEEQVYLEQILNSPNHAVLISPRRFGKSSLVKEVLNTQDREVISVNLQAITSVHRLAEALYRQFFSTHPVEKAKHYFSKLRVAPTISYNPLTGSPEFSLQPTTDKQVVLEDAFGVLESANVLSSFWMNSRRFWRLTKGWTSCCAPLCRSKKISTIF